MPLGGPAAASSLIEVCAAGVKYRAPLRSTRRLTDLPGVTAAVVGASSVERISQNFGAVGLQLDEAHRARLVEESAIDLGYSYSLIDNLNQTTAHIRAK